MFVGVCMYAPTCISMYGMCMYMVRTRKNDGFMFCLNMFLTYVISMQHTDRRIQTDTCVHARARARTHAHACTSL